MTYGGLCEHPIDVWIGGMTPAPYDSYKNDLIRLMSDRIYTDVMFVFKCDSHQSDDAILYAHRNILMARCLMLGSVCKGGGIPELENQNGVIHLKKPFSEDRITHFSISPLLENFWPYTSTYHPSSLHSPSWLLSSDSFQCNVIVIDDVRRDLFLILVCVFFFLYFFYFSFFLFFFFSFFSSQLFELHLSH
jgi:hypothetical protein